ncbi:MAG: hypothetical protein MJZ02_02585 [Paludibacteraceae bacterium]|nr:hypothetical protein [Paludibacteraceae bacterium]
MKKTLFTLFLAITSFVGYAKPDFEIPEIPNYASAEDASKDNEIALKTAKFYLEAKLPEDVVYSKQAAQFLIVWATVSEDISITLDEKKCQFMKCENPNVGTQLLLAYMSGCIVYGLENKQKDFNFDMHYFALTKTLEYYVKNKAVSGSDKIMDKLVKEAEKKNFKEKEQKKF